MTTHTREQLERLVKKLRDHADGPDGTAPDGGDYQLGRDLNEAANSIESLLRDAEAWQKERQEIADAIERAIFVVGSGKTHEEALADAHDKRRMELDPLLIRLSAAIGEQSE